MSVRIELGDSAGMTRLLSLCLARCDWPHQAKHLDSYIGAPVPAERHSFRNMASLREAARASTRSECLGPCHDLPSHIRLLRIRDILNPLPSRHGPHCPQV